MLPRLAILEGQNVVRVHDFMEWAEWLKQNQRHLGWTEICDATVSTLFTGIDTANSEKHNPRFFETLIMGGPYDGYLRRYNTYKEALAGHKTAVTLLRMETC